MGHPITLGVPAFFSGQVKYVRSFYLDLAPPPDTGLTVVCGGFERCHPDYVIDRANFPYLGLEFVASGAGSLSLAGQEVTLTPGLVFCYGPGIAHGSRGGALATQLCRSRLKHLILRIAASLSPGHEDHTAALSTYIRCRRYIEEHHARLTKLQEIAGECGVSEAYLCRLFQRYDRQTPCQFLTRLKMSRAAKLLEDPGRLVRQIASDLSDRDAFPFSRVFKNVFGVSPRGFRETFDDSGLSLPL